MVRPVLIGNVSGATGDRQDAMLKMLTGSIKVDAIVGDWLSEMNLSWRALEFEQDPNKGYEMPFLHSFVLAAKQFAARNTKLVVNAGAFNPKQLAMEVQKVLDKNQGGSKVVAWLEGDDVLPYALESPDKLRSMSEDRTLKDWGKEPLSATVYLGAWGIVKALQKGADIVITGRVTDASPVIGVAAWWHGWRDDDFDKLAHALAAGHLVECGPYVTGGNFPGFKSLMPKFYDLSFPIAEIHDDGTSHITKQPDQNGIVSVETVKTQFLYELQGPFYFNPDVVADFSNITFTSSGLNRVQISNVCGLPAPPNLKVIVQAREGYQAEFSLHPVGLDIHEKVESFKEMTNQIIKKEVDMDDIQVLEFQLYGAVAQNPRSQREATSQLRVFVQAATADTVSRITRLALSNSLSGYPGIMMNMDLRTAQPKLFLDFWPGLVPRACASQKVHFPKLQTTHAVPDIVRTMTLEEVPKQPSYEPASPVALSRFGPTHRIPLGYIVYARSGDKGPNVNVGFFCSGGNAIQRKAKWDWLRSFLTIVKLRELLGDDDSGEKIERCEFPGIAAVHFVVHGVLGRGVGSTSKLDAFGKNLAEYLRARVVDMPTRFYESQAKI